MSRILLSTVLALPLLSACTDAEMGKFRALGNPAQIDCYSGGKLIYSGKSTGKIRSEQSSDGYYFTDSNRLVHEVSGNCVITYDR